MANQDWKENFGFSNPPYIEHNVGDKSHNFYQTSAWMALRLKSLGASVAKLLGLIFSNDKDNTIVYRQAENFSETINEAINPALADTRFKQKENAAESVIEALMSDKNAFVVADLIMDSMRDDFSRVTKERPSPGEFLQETPLPALVDMLMGVAKANKDALGPLKSLLSDLNWQEIKTGVADRMKNLKTNQTLQ